MRLSLQKAPPLKAAALNCFSSLLLALASFALMALAATLGDWLMG